MSLHRYESVPSQEARRDSDEELELSDNETEVLRTSDDFRRHDQETISTEEEVKRLLTGSGKNERGLTGLFRRDGKPKDEKRVPSKRRRKSSWRRGRGGEDGELMYKVEEGGRSSSTDVSSDEDSGRPQETPEKHQTKFSRFGRFTIIHLLILILFLGFVYGAYKASQGAEPSKPAYVAKTLSNGTHDFAPTTILISLDGFRADFLHRGLTPTLKSLIQQGVSPRYMNPSFPSLTFPNHFTLVTGLHPESHGIVGNSFWDPNMQKGFTYGWLDLPGPQDQGASLETPRPQLIAAYVPNVDSDGHKYGPNSTYIRSTITEVDGMLGKIFKGIEERNLTNVVNIVVVSDHGMATTSNQRVVQLEDLVDTSLIEHTDGWPLFGLRPFDQSEEKLMEIYNEIYAKVHSSEHQGKFEVYLRDKNMPQRYHFSQNDRIAPLWIVPKAGWAIAPKHEFDLATALDRGETYDPLGLHGYDHEHPLMRAIFVARGPAFPHTPGSRLRPFQNTEVYNILCDSLGIEPRPNNGTIRLPFQTDGLHDFEAFVPEPDDPPPIDHIDASILLPPPVIPADGSSFNPPVPEAAIDDGDGTQDGTVNGTWREWFNDKIQEFKQWASGVFGKGKEQNSEDAEPV
ncbi:putative pyrophosphatase/phosphodiesterase [Pseudocercospora fuligena]|uniref:Putative pyrophosphatase/phosphodiesterase n=1 Tax=Pseudocercospora fuligena TaxID=685502 RepID=A0A8H6VI87_9PEZI|nr:putative pyrophosphatase/phosphodiesterase [Pseudocercospora fuligena]